MRTGWPIGQSRRNEPAPFVSTIVRHPASGGGADAVGDDGRVVTLVEVHAPEEHEDAAPADLDRADRRAVAGDRGRREAGHVGERHGRPVAELRGGARPARPEHDGDVVEVDAGAGSEHGGGMGGEPERLGIGGRHRIGILRSALDAHHRVARRPRRARRPDEAPADRRVAGGARRRHDDRRHPPPRRARRAGDRGRRRVRRRARRARGARRRPRARRGGAHRRGPADGRQPVVGRAPRRRPPAGRDRCGRRRGRRAVRGGRPHQPGAGDAGRGAARGAARRPCPAAHPLQRRWAGVCRVGHRAGDRAGDARAWVARRR